MTKMMAKAYNEAANCGFTGGLENKIRMALIEGQMASKLQRQGASVDASEIRNYISARNAELQAVTSDFRF